VSLPATMFALRLHKFDGLKSLRLEEVSVPKLERDEVLIKVAASPINPSDELFCDGLYKIPACLPFTPGFEGSGVVVENGGSFFARRLMGKWVAAATQRQNGFWAEYVKVKAWETLSFDPNSLTPEKAAMSFVNPLSAMALIEPMTQGRHRAMIQTAAASQLGRMIARLAKRHNIPIIHCVHRKELIPVLKNLGAEHVLLSTSSHFASELGKLAHDLKATYAIDAVGGPMTGQLAEAMPHHSTITVYGALARQPVSIDPGSFIFKDLRVEGFWLGEVLSKKSLMSQAIFMWRAKSDLNDGLSSKISRTIALRNLPQIIPSGLGLASDGKIIIKPNPDTSLS
jgi:NADPH:quinone reductase